MRRRTERRHIEFRGSPGGALERVVTLPDGRQYIHRCSEQIFRQVAAWLDDHSDLVTMTAIADAIDAPLTQVNVALELLKERGMLLPADGRRSHIPEGYASAFFEHAMTEFYALIEGHPPTLSDG